MSTQQTAVTQYIEVLGIRTAYRLFSIKKEIKNNIPSLFNQYFRDRMDYWDPLLIILLPKSAH